MLYFAFDKNFRGKSFAQYYSHIAGLIKERDSDENPALIRFICENMLSRD